MFTNLLKKVVLILKTKGVRLIIYLDDILIMNSFRLALQDDLSETLQLLILLRFHRQLGKLVCSPTQRIWASYSIRGISHSHFHRESFCSIAQQCQAILRHKHCVLRSLASILGLLSWSASAVPFAQAHFRAIKILFIIQLGKEYVNLSHSASPSESARQDLECEHNMAAVFYINRS